MTSWDDPIHIRSINTLRFLAVDAIELASSGHPGLPLGASPMAYVLWSRHLRHNPRDPAWPDRDRFVFSAGHGSMLLYGLLHLTGYDLTIDDLKQFRQFDSRTPGHTESITTPGVECTTGPLGQGFGNAVGLALAERLLAHRFNRPDHEIVDHLTYCLCSDGDMMEGVASEAASLAGQLALGRLICLYDSNGVTLDGPTSLTFSVEDVAARFEAYGWHVQQVADGDHDLEGIDRAIAQARLESRRPSLVIVRTTIGYGAPRKQGRAAVHGAPLGAEEVHLTKRNLGWDTEEPFFVPDDVRRHMDELAARGRVAQQVWQERFSRYAMHHPQEAAAWRRLLCGELPAGWDEELPSYEPGRQVSTRQASGEVLNAIAARLPELIGGDADLSSSTLTRIRDSEDFDSRTGAGRNLRFGVREHAMAAIGNGLAYHGGLRPFVSTFLVFSDYMRPAVRLAALARLPVIFVWTHDSVGLGEDGPTHQPIEQLASLRAIPNLTVLRPCDAAETVEAWRWAMQHREGPVALALSRQKLPVCERDDSMAPASELQRGGYVLRDPADGQPPQGIFIATGSETAIALQAQRSLEQEGVPVRVVSLPSWELFARQSEEYRRQVLPPELGARVSAEAGSTFGWQRWTGDGGVTLGVDRFGASAPGATNMERFGFTADRLAAAMRAALDRPAQAASAR